LGGALRLGGSLRLAATRGFRLLARTLLLLGATSLGLRGLVLLATEDHRIGERVEDDLDRSVRVVVAGDRDVDEARIAVGVDEGDDRDADLLRFEDGVVLPPDVDHHEGPRDLAHLADALEVPEDLPSLTPEG